MQNLEISVAILKITFSEIMFAIFLSCDLFGEVHNATQYFFHCRICGDDKSGCQ